MTRIVRTMAAVVLALVSSCEHPPAPAPTDRITLSAAQAAAVNARLALVTQNSGLAFLADSASLVIRAGAEVTRVSLSTDLGDKQFHAVSLHRAIIQSAERSFSTFHVLLFDDLVSPSDFLIVGGYVPADGSQPPQSMGGGFGEMAAWQVTGHIFAIDGKAVQAWRALTGTASFATDTSGSRACVAIEPTTNVACEQITMDATFDIESSEPDGGGASDSKSASMTTRSVAGIKLRYGGPP